MVKIEIITKRIVEKITEDKILKLENRFYKDFQKLRERIIELEEKQKGNKYS